MPSVFQLNSGNFNLAISFGDLNVLIGPDFYPKITVKCLNIGTHSARNRMTILGTFHSEYAGRIYFSSSDSGNLVIHFAIRAYKHSKRTILVLFARHPQLKCLNIGTQSAQRGLHPCISFLLFLIVFFMTMASEGGQLPQSPVPGI